MPLEHPVEELLVGSDLAGRVTIITSDLRGSFINT